MLFKKSIEQGNVEDIRFVKGAVKFQSFELSVYCFETDGVMIDTASQSLYSLTKPFFETVNVDQVILTHNHEDHTGGARFFAEQQTPIFIHPDSVEAVNQRVNYPLYRKLFWGSRKPFSANPLSQTFTSRKASWEVIETPGHTKDHVSLLNLSTGKLFTGDLFVSPKTKVILKDESIPEIARSIEKVLTYDFQQIVCNHAGIIQDGKQALRLKHENLLAFIDEVLQLQNRGMDKQQIHAQLFPKKYPIQSFSNGEWHSMHMVTSVLNDSIIKGRILDGQTI